MDQQYLLFLVVKVRPNGLQLELTIRFEGAIKKVEIYWDAGLGLTQTPK